jgi:hypothetical protein
MGRSPAEFVNATLTQSAIAREAPGLASDLRSRHFWVPGFPIARAAISKYRTARSPRLARPLLTLGPVVRKLFIVAADNEAMYRTLCKVLERESLVDVIYDRRKHTSDSLGKEERRVRSDVDERIRSDGYAVVRLTLETREGNARWSAPSPRRNVSYESRM